MDPKQWDLFCKDSQNGTLNLSKLPKGKTFFVGMTCICQALLVSHLLAADRLRRHPDMWEAPLQLVVERGHPCRAHRKQRTSWTAYGKRS